MLNQMHVQEDEGARRRSTGSPVPSIISTHSSVSSGDNPNNNHDVVGSVGRDSMTAKIASSLTPQPPPVSSSPRSRHSMGRMSAQVGDFSVASQKNLFLHMQAEHHAKVERRRSSRSLLMTPESSSQPGISPTKKLLDASNSSMVLPPPPEAPEEEEEKTNLDSPSKSVSTLVTAPSTGSPAVRSSKKRISSTFVRSVRSFTTPPPHQRKSHQSKCTPVAVGDANIRGGSTPGSASCVPPSASPLAGKLESSMTDIVELKPSAENQGDDEEEYTSMEPDGQITMVRKTPQRMSMSVYDQLRGSIYKKPGALSTFLEEDEEEEKKEINSVVEEDVENDMDLDRVGIERPSYGDPSDIKKGDDTDVDDASLVSESSHRIGIVRPSYSKSDDKEPNDDYIMNGVGISEKMGLAMTPIQSPPAMIAATSPPRLLKAAPKPAVLGGTTTRVQMYLNGAPPLGRNQERKSLSPSFAPSITSVKVPRVGRSPGGMVTPLLTYEEECDEDNEDTRSVGTQSTSISKDSIARFYHHEADSPRQKPKKRDRVSGRLASAHSSASSFPTQASTGRRPSRRSFDGSSSSSAGDIVKIFVLLLEPDLKIFELIQIAYSSKNATVGDILTLIPVNSTEPKLGNKVHRGLCRPVDEKPDEKNRMLDMSTKASGKGKKSARIGDGEILVAIPQGFTVGSCVRLARQILKNQKLGKLLAKAAARAESLGEERKLKRGGSDRSLASSKSGRSRRRSYQGSQQQQAEILSITDGTTTGVAPAKTGKRDNEHELGTALTNASSSKLTTTNSEITNETVELIKTAANDSASAAAAAILAEKITEMSQFMAAILSDSTSGGGAKGNLIDSADTSISSESHRSKDEVANRLEQMFLDHLNLTAMNTTPEKDPSGLKQGSAKVDKAIVGDSAVDPHLLEMVKSRAETIGAEREARNQGKGTTTTAGNEGDDDELEPSRQTIRPENVQRDMNANNNVSLMEGCDLNALPSAQAMQDPPESCTVNDKTATSADEASSDESDGSGAFPKLNCSDTKDSTGGGNEEKPASFNE